LQSSLVQFHLARAPQAKNLYFSDHDHVQLTPEESFKPDHVRLFIGPYPTK
jgi:hypothetical protein